MSVNTVYYTVIFIYGIVIGSFLNVCIYRIPEGFSIVTERSRCRSCNSQIKWYDLIPILSYILLLGRCRNCKTKISVQYPIVEALNGLFYVLVFYIYGFNSIREIIISCGYCLLVSALLVLSLIDLKTNTIPIAINIFIALTGLFVSLFKYFISGRDINIIIDHAVGLLSVSVFLYIIYLVTHGNGIGGGDIKLMGAAGLALGGSKIILAFLTACVLAAVIHPIRMKISKLSKVLAFGPYLSAGIIISLLFGKQLIEWYLNSFFA